MLRRSPRALVREDYCNTCWEFLQENTRRDDIYSWWLTTFGRTERRRHSLARLLLDLLQEAQADAKHDRVAAGIAFLAAFTLCRRRVLRLVRTEREGDQGRCFLFWNRKERTEIRVSDPVLSGEELAEARRLLKRRLSNALR